MHRKYKLIFSASKRAAIAYGFRSNADDIAAEATARILMSKEPLKVTFIVIDIIRKHFGRITDRNKDSHSIKAHLTHSNIELKPSMISTDLDEDSLSFVELVSVLPEQYQELLIMRFIQGYSTLEMAELSGRSPGYLGQMINKAFMLLKMHHGEDNLKELLQSSIPTRKTLPLSDY